MFTIIHLVCLVCAAWYRFCFWGCFLTAFSFRRTSEIFQTVFLLCSSTTACSTDPCQVQCGNDKHPLYPSSEVPAALSHKRGSHILALDRALMSRINLEKHKANVSSGHVNMANSARRLTGKERKRETSRQKVWVRSGKSDRWETVDRHTHTHTLTHTHKGYWHQEAIDLFWFACWFHFDSKSLRTVCLCFLCCQFSHVVKFITV